MLLNIMLEHLIKKIKILIGNSFTGELRISFYRGGISKKVKVIKTEELTET